LCQFNVKEFPQQLILEALLLIGLKSYYRWLAQWYKPWIPYIRQFVSEKFPCKHVTQIIKVSLDVASKLSTFTPVNYLKPSTPLPSINIQSLLSFHFWLTTLFIYKKLTMYRQVHLLVLLFKEYTYLLTIQRC